jgi:small subunit ribosomal protein S17
MKGQRRRLIGRVASDKMDKTVVVEVERRKRHRIYGKVLKRTQKYMAHDEENVCRIGDLVRIVESRPLSRRKHWVVEQIMETGGWDDSAGIQTTDSR